jgi:hypothetical protein
MFEERMVVGKAEKVCGGLDPYLPDVAVVEVADGGALKDVIAGELAMLREGGGGAGEYLDVGGATWGAEVIAGAGEYRTAAGAGAIEGGAGE